MSVINCINLCEILSIVYDRNNPYKHVIDKIKIDTKKEVIHRIYIGSYFCSQYFLYINEHHIRELVSSLMNSNIKITLVIPIITEKHLEKAKKKIGQILDILSYNCDEITVNDYGMLDYINKTYVYGINLGRLFMKDYRDPRHEDYFLQTYKTRVFTDFMLALIESMHIKSCEWDLSHEILDLSHSPDRIDIGIHRPYSYMTVGHICEIGSINKDISKKYRPNESCRRECESYFISYDFEMEREWMKYGRALYYKNDDCTFIIPETSSNREIYFPIKEVLK